MKTSEILKKALQYIKKGWCKDYWARDNKGKKVYYDDASAIKFCATGAICKVSHTNAKADQLMLKVVGGESVADWNDDPKRTKKQVIAGLRLVSKPGRRQYVKKTEIPLVLRGLGISIISTSKGLLTDKDARKMNVGGELLCSVW